MCDTGQSPAPLQERVRLRGGHSRGIRAPFPWAFVVIRGHLRAFAVLLIRDVAPEWRHPVLDRSITDLAADLPDDQDIRTMPDADGYLGTEWRSKA